MIKLCHHDCHSIGGLAFCRATAVLLQRHRSRPRYHEYPFPHYRFLQNITAPAMTRLQLPDRNRLSMQRDRSYTDSYSFRSAKLSEYRVPPGWQVDSLQRLTLDKYAMDCPYIAQFSCSAITYLKLQACGPCTEDHRSETCVRLPDLEQFPLLEKVRLRNFVLLHGSCFLEPFAKLKT